MGLTSNYSVEVLLFDLQKSLHLPNTIYDSHLPNTIYDYNMIITNYDHIKIEDGGGGKRSIFKTSLLIQMKFRGRRNSKWLSIFRVAGPIHNGTFKRGFWSGINEIENSIIFFQKQCKNFRIEHFSS